MVNSAELTEENFKRAYHFAHSLLVHVGPLFLAMQLTRDEAELGFALLLGESLSHRDKELRRLLADQWQELAIDAAEKIEKERRRWA